jgi:hypothetical protein
MMSCEKVDLIDRRDTVSNPLALLSHTPEHHGLFILIIHFGMESIDNWPNMPHGKVNIGAFCPCGSVNHFIA